MTDIKFDQAKNWFEDLHNQLIKIISDIDGKEFIITNWNHRHEGGGTTAKIKGLIFQT